MACSYFKIRDYSSGAYNTGAGIPSTAGFSFHSNQLRTVHFTLDGPLILQNQFGKVRRACCGRGILPKLEALSNLACAETLAFARSPRCS